MLDRRQVVQAATAIALAGRRANGSTVPAPAPRKVLLVDGDDWGAENFNATKTPEMWARAANGVRFTKFWARPVCSAFRAALLTGCESIRPENYTGAHIPTTSTYKGPTGPWFTSVVAGAKTMRGKYHLVGGAVGQAHKWPGCVVGPGRFHAYSGSHSNLDFGGTGYYDWTKGWASSAGSGTAATTTFATNDTHADASADVAADVGLVRACFNAVHKPLDLPPPSGEGGTYAQGGIDEYLRHWDWRMGQLIDRAVAAGYVVIVCGDNGTADGGKGTYTEAGLNTPCFVVGRGVRVGVSKRLVQCTDLGPTVAELMGSSFSTPDGHSFADAILESCSGSPARAALTCTGYPDLGVAPTPSTLTRATRDQRFKLVDDGGSVLFWDLQTDPTEANPIAPTTRRELAAFEALTAALPI